MPRKRKASLSSKKFGPGDEVYLIKNGRVLKVKIFDKETPALNEMGYIACFDESGKHYLPEARDLYETEEEAMQHT